IRDRTVTGVQTCALPISHRRLATDVVAANHRAGTDQVDRAVGSIGEVVALDEYRNVAGHDAATIAVEVVVANGDGAAALALALRSEERRVGKEWSCRGAV